MKAYKFLRNDMRSDCSNEPAWAAARDAEIEWQKQHLDELMEAAFKVGLETVVN